MERLTKRTVMGIVGNNDMVENYPLYKVAEYDELDHGIIGQCFDKLAQYEDAEKQGLMLRLPCKVGDTVYKVWSCGKNGKSIAEFEISHICVDNPQFIEFSMISKKSKNAMYPYRFFKDFEIGETVFLTRAEAEQELKEMESD